VIVVTTFDRDDYLFAALDAGRERFPAQERRRRRADLRGPGGRGRRCAARARGHAARDRTVRGGIRPSAVVSASPPAAPWPVADSLTEREVEVLRLVAQAHSNAEIARELFIGEATVKTHVSNVLQKLDARDRVHAAVLAHQHGLA
jgi:DNA-binding NarL/FixJ family response regulator